MTTATARDTQPGTPSGPAPSFGLSAQALAIVDLALAEDVGRGDLTTEATVDPSTTAVAEIVQKEAGVLCGLPVVEAVFARLDSRVRVAALAAEGSRGESGRVVARIDGPAASILTGERTALNFLQRLSGVATASRTAADLTAGTATRVVDTRKTSPGMRALEKYAVRVGGCRNHRAGLDDGFLIKENHIRAAGGIASAVAAARERTSLGQLVETEVTSLDELEQAIAAGSEVVLLDNFSVAGLREAVAHTAGRARLEASGGITLANLAEVAHTGVDYVSLGALTHSARALDFSLLFRR
jgi:nicotinate-nucleotide pyrophosphorylase (carboxylating)